MNKTIYALSTASGQAGVAIIRLSGSQSLYALETLCGLKNPTPNHAYFRPLMYQGQKIDEALILYFQSPKSFTGEDVVEIQCHGSRAVLNELLDILGTFPNYRLAEPGEFTRRALLNGKMDLTAAEGLIDLIHADTKAQAQWALRQMGGELQRLYDEWREELKYALAYLEAFIDFPEEEIPPSQLEIVQQKTYNVITNLTHHLDDKNRGKSLKEGILFAIIGAPNVGKSSLLNALVKKEIAIVNTRAGTTRDVIETYLDIEGYPVILADTAGLREAEEEIEAEGIRRALTKASEADFVILVEDGALYPQTDKETEKLIKGISEDKIIRIWNKKDVMPPHTAFAISAKTGEGLPELHQKIAKLTVAYMNSPEPMLTRARYKEHLMDCLNCLRDSLKAKELELKAEDLRLAVRALGKITGKVEVEELLDVIFSQFCIGK